jgi:hypothetical protein
VFLVLVHSFSLFAQEAKNVIDTLLVQPDSTLTDTLLTNIRHPSANAIDKKVTYKAAGHIERDVINKRVVLIQEAVVNYGEIEIKADSIVFNMSTNLLFAAGRQDTSGKIIGTPVFKEGSQEFKAQELTYNFKTRKALIKNIITKQEDGLVHSTYAKLLEDGTSNISKSTYSTCDADTPHFYINLPKARVYPGKKIISGPGNLVIEGIPLPLFIPFGYFPVQTKKAASGLLFPRIGQEQLRGYSLSDGGYYFAVSDYLDLSLKGNIYSNGTWISTVQTNYNRLYRYSGNFSFNYASNVTGHKGLQDYAKTTNYRLGWIYTQNPKASPGSTFSASVNMSSSGYDRNNSYAVAEHATTQRQSSVSYSKSWEGTPFNLSASMNHSQNVKNKTVSLNLPKVSFNAGRIYPLKGKNSSGKSKWYKELQFQYSSSLDNQISTNDSLLFTNKVWKNMRNGFKHEAPLSLQIRPFRNFSISPSVTYSGVAYSQKIERKWDSKSLKVVNDTLKGVFYGQALNPAISASFNPQVFGMYSFTNPNSRIQAIRHVIKPSVGFSFIPKLDGPSYKKMYRQVQIDTTGRNFSPYYSVFEGNIYGTPSASSKSGNLSFSLVNIVEAKVFAKNDTTGKPKKVKIIDNFGINTSYNIFADSMRWAPVSMQMRTTLLNSINISANSNFTLYGVDSKGKPTAAFAFTQNKKLMRLNSFTTSLDFSLSDLLKGGPDKKKSTTAASSSTQNSLNQGGRMNDPLSGPNETESDKNKGGNFDAYGYSVFDVPWSLNLSYSLNYYKSSLKPNLTQTLSVNGNVTFTKKMSMTYTSGYDFKNKVITMTNIGIKRDLHCWEMNFNWIPIGYMKGWNFTIRVKASVLGDLKYERRKDFHDTY